MSTFKPGDISIYHYCEDNSDKVWGFYCLETSDGTGGVQRAVHKFWGKRTAAIYATDEAISLEGVVKLAGNKEKKGYIKLDPNDPICKEVKSKIRNFQTQSIVSCINSEELLQSVSIRPSEVFRTRLVWEAERNEDVVLFFGKSGNPLGQRPIKDMDAIFTHLLKTKNAIPTELGAKGEPKTIEWEQK